MGGVGKEGISATPDPNIMVFTNRLEEFEGFGRLNVASGDRYSATVSYTSLGLGSAQDYFDVNDGVNVTVTKDGKYAFVAGRNARRLGSGIPSIDSAKGGSNVGIIVDPLTENAKLVAATRPIPDAWTNDVSLTGDDKYLFATYPGAGSVFAWDVNEMIATLDNPTPYTIDHLGRGIQSPAFLPSSARNATKADLSKVPIDNINPLIDIASDLQIIEERIEDTGTEFISDVTFGVPENSPTAPLTVGFNPWTISSASVDTGNRPDFRRKLRINEREVRNQDLRCENCGDKVPGTSEIETHSGAIIETHNFVSYQSNGLERGISLTYDSLRADPRPITHFGYDDIDSSELNDNSILMGEMTVQGNGLEEYQVPGFEGGNYGLDGGEHFWELPEESGNISAAIQADLTQVPSGRYEYNLSHGIHDFDGEEFIGAASTQTGEIIHVNTADSAFGSGWGISGLSELVENDDGSLLLIDGDGGEMMFEPPTTPGGNYISPPGDFSSMQKLADGSYRRVTKEQMVYDFSPDCQLISVSDRNGNRTAYFYDGEQRLTKIVDPVGLETTLAYNANGKVSRITDPGDRETRLSYDESGNLTRITDPDGTNRTWTYDDQHHMVSETDKRGNVEQAFYDQFGRATGSITKDGATIEIEPLQTQVVLDPAATIDPNNPGMATVETDAPSTGYTDTNGNETQTVLDKAGQQVSSVDDEGSTGTIERNESNSVSSTVDGEGNESNFTYDSRNNLLSSEETSVNSEGNSETLTTSFTYDPQYSLPTSITNPDGKQTLYEIDPDNGNMLSSTKVMGIHDPQAATDIAGDIDIDSLSPAELSNLEGQNDLTTEYTYNSAGLVETETDSFGRVTAYDYDNLGHITQMTTAQGTEDETVVKYEYDSAGNQSAIIDSLGNRSEFEYDKLNRVTKITEADPDGDGELTSPLTNFEYDEAGNLVETTDALGNITTNKYDKLDRPTTSSNADDGVSLAEYDRNSNVIRTLDEAGRESFNTYDSRDRLILSIDPEGNETKFKYDLNDNLIEVTDPLLNKITYVYDSRNRLITERDAEGNETKYEYDGRDNLTATIDPLGNRTEYQYDDANRQIGMTNALGDSSSTIYDLNGNVISITDELARTTTFEYDLRDRLVKTIDAEGGEIEFEFDTVENLISTTDELDRTTRYSYDALNRQIETTDALSNTNSATFDGLGNLITATDGNKNVTHYAYDSLNRLSVVTNPFDDKVTTNYDAVGNVTSVVDTLGRETKFTYDKRGLRTTITDPLENVTTTKYDAVGNPLEEIDPLGNKTSYSYDKIYRLIATTDGEERTTNYSFDRAGNLITVTDPEENTTTYEYDKLNRMLSDTNQLGDARSYVYDKVGNLIATTDRNGRVINYSYDKLDRNTSEVWLDSEANPIHTFDFTYDGASQLTNAQDVFSAYGYSYDKAGRLTAVDNAGTPGVPNVVFNYGFDSANNLTSVSDSINGVDAGVENFSYDKLNRVTDITQSGTGIQDKRIDYTYNKAGQRVKSDRYSDLAGENIVASTEYAYDRNGRLTDLDHNRGEENLANFDYSYDKDSRIVEIASDEGISIFNYDNTDQLTGAEHSNQDNEEYTYDNNGNRVGDDINTGEDNQLLTDGVYNYTYDGEGNRTSQTEIATGIATEYTWDYRNRLTEVVTKDAAGDVVERNEYTYDVNDQRIAKSVDADGDGAGEAEVERYVHDGGEIALVFDGEGNQTERFFHSTGVDEVLAQENTGGEVLWALADQQGSVRVLMDNSGAVVNEITYDAFGKITVETNPDIFRFSYTGRELDPETELYNYRTRYLDPFNGKFINEDTIGFEGGDSNLYRYVANSPLNYTDPYGEDLYSVLNTVDKFAAGFSDAVTFGATTKLRESVYGDIAKRNHSGGIFISGQITGTAASFVLGYGAEANAAKLAPWLLKGIRAYDVLGSTVDGYNSVKNIASGCWDWTDLLGLAPAVGGLSYWKQFDKVPDGISFRTDLKHHLAIGDGLKRAKNTGIQGAHNLNSFNSEVAKHNLNITDIKNSPDIKGLQEIRYQMPSKNKAGDITGYRAEVKKPKTVYDPKRFPDDVIVSWGQKAANKGYDRAIKNGQTQYTEVVAGMKFRVILDSNTKHVSSVFPEL